MIRARTQAGFTLTETLVAVALLALIAAASVPILRGGISAYTRLTETARVEESHAGLEQALRLALSSALDLPSEDGFSGTEGGFAFFAQPEGASGLIRVTVEALPDSIEVRFRPQGARQTQSEAFFDLPEFAGLYYYGSHNQGERPDWYQAWEGPHPPRLVVLDFAAGADGRTRRLEIAVGGQAGLRCDYDSGLQACREGI